MTDELLPSKQDPLVIPERTVRVAPMDHGQQTRRALAQLLLLVGAVFYFLIGREPSLTHTVPHAHLIGGLFIVAGFVCRTLQEFTAIGNIQAVNYTRRNSTFD